MGSKLFVGVVLIGLTAGVAIHNAWEKMRNKEITVGKENGVITIVVKSI